MAVIGFVAVVLHVLLSLYVLLLFARVILDFIPMFNREWRPRGVALVLCEAVYTVTDPPLKYLRRHLQPIRLGPIAIDLAFPLTMICCFIALSILRAIAIVF
ncbi:YggT family protein [Microbacterium nanhaiense]|uniref:YggT family protein n=1 Tax=Microbacterium nanhaiense TaxID=1301026 RepID=A0ABQ2MZF8_9MICO|nr:YggT family protein [Microbacterium nanhaiense]GGO60717.1 YggT family protein [Microbacterium nanhaiense]